jgi:hypothetical protein
MVFSSSAVQALSGYQMWKNAGKKAAAGTKQWAARVLTKQAQKTKNHLIEKWKIYRGGAAS